MHISRDISSRCETPPGGRPTLNTKAITLAAVALTVLNKGRRQRIKLRIQMRNSQMCRGFDLSRSTRATRHHCSLAPPGAAAESEASGCTRQILSRVNARKKIPPSSFRDRFLHGNVCNSSSRERKNYEATPERFFFLEFQVVVPLHFHYVVTRFPLRLPRLEEPRAAARPLNSTCSGTPSRDSLYAPQLFLH